MDGKSSSWSQSQEYNDDSGFDDDEPPYEPIPEPRLPDLDLPASDLDLTMTFESIIHATEDPPKSSSKGKGVETQDNNKVFKRQSDVMKLYYQNEKLKEELRAMTERLEAAERKQKELADRARQKQTKPTTS